MSVRQVFTEIQVGVFYVSVEKVDRPRWQRAHSVFFLCFTEAHCFVVWLHTNKSWPFSISNDELFLYVQYVLICTMNQYFWSFSLSLTKNMTKRTGTVFDPRRSRSIPNFPLIGNCLEGTGDHSLPVRTHTELQPFCFLTILLVIYPNCRFHIRI